MGGITDEREAAVGWTAKSIGEYDRVDLHDRVTHLYSASLVGFTELKAGFDHPAPQRTTRQIVALVSRYYRRAIGCWFPVELHLVEPDALVYCFNMKWAGYMILGLCPCGNCRITSFHIVNNGKQKNHTCIADCFSWSTMDIKYKKRLYTCFEQWYDGS